MTKLVKSVFDLFSSLFLLLASPLLKMIARNRLSLPKVQRMQDRIGVHIRGDHYYEPTYSERDLPTVTSTPRALPGIELNEVVQLKLLSQFTYAAELREIPLDPPGVGQFGYHNEMYSFGDAEIYYSMIRLHKPKRIIEIGSGNSTLMARRAIEKNVTEDPDYRCEQICIEPYEMPWLEASGVTVIRERVETISLSVFSALQAGDFLFVDSSHIIRPWGDVLREVHEIFPMLKPGVFVQVHDIFTPFDYPEHWLRRERRLWNEQYLLEAFLAFNSRFDVICAANWLKHMHWDAFCEACPLMLDHPEQDPGAFWMLVK
jgi:predicted O-methyltransferase YrrM